MTSAFLESIRVDQDNLTDRMLDPDGGIALVEIAVNPQPILQTLAARAEALPDVQALTTACMWHNQENPGRVTYVARKLGQLFIDASEEHELLSPLIKTTRNVLQPLLDAVDDDKEAFVMTVLGEKRSKLSNNHVDKGTVVTSWYGATQPGLSVYHHGAWESVDTLPANHVLFWRGKKPGFTDGLPAQRHRVNYRSAIRRYVMVGWS